MAQENLGAFVSKFVSERVATPHPEEIEAWSQLDYAELFSVGFIIWLPVAKKCLSEDDMTNQLNNLIDEIAKDANVWIHHKVQETLKVSGLNITINSVSEIKFHLSAMFKEAIAAMTESKLSLELARSHACFVHLQANLRKLTLVSKVQIDVKDVLTKGLSGCDALVEEIQKSLKSKRVS